MHDNAYRESIYFPWRENLFFRPTTCGQVEIFVFCPTTCRQVEIFVFCEKSR